MDNFDIFEDRVLSLLKRWKDWKNNHKSNEGIDKSAIQGCLNEINDAFTQELLK